MPNIKTAEEAAKHELKTIQPYFDAVELKEYQAPLGWSLSIGVHSVQEQMKKDGQSKALILHNGLKVPVWVNSNPYDIEHIKDLMFETASLKAALKEAVGFLQKLSANPYPEDVFLPVTPEQLHGIHKMLQRQFSNMPIDRLSGHIGREIYKGIADQAQSIIQKSQTHLKD